MKYDIILCGVGGQGVLSVASVIATAATEAGLIVKQSEVHGMSQRGGAVMASLRISEKPIASPLISQGRADMIISMEPLESLRYLPFLSKKGMIITASTPLKNISNYPDLNELYTQIKTIPRTVLIDAEKPAREAGSARASNIVLVGAASRYLPLKQEIIESAITHLFSRKGAPVVELNINAFRVGRTLEGLNE